MKKLFVILLVMLVICLSGCGYFERLFATTKGYSRMCVDGVEYIQFTSGVTVSYNTNGTIKTCR
jgi:uncharacterized protein YceK